MLERPARLPQKKSQQYKPDKSRMDEMLLTHQQGNKERRQMSNKNPTLINIISLGVATHLSYLGLIYMFTIHNTVKEINS